MDAGRATPFALGWMCLVLALSLCAAVAMGSDTPGSATVTLAWSAPGDDGDVGTAARFDVRYSLDPLDESNFAAGTEATDLPEPARAGTRQHLKIRGLDAGRLYYFGLRTVDDAGNWSPLSTVAFQTPGSSTRPTPIPALQISLSAVYPMPVRDHMRLDIRLPRAMTVQAVVMDPAGRRVKWLANATYPQGVTPLQWNLVDEKGRRLEAGVYWVLGMIGEQRFRHRFMVVH